jgi:hypothetical protein
MRRRMYVPNEPAREIARNLRETFVDRPVEQEIAVPWRWPRALREVGVCESVMYASDKWQKRRDEIVDYKHVAEGPQWVLARPGFLVHYDRPDRKLPVAGPMIELGPMPDSFAVLADILGVQVRLYESTDDGYALPSDSTEGFYEVTIARAKLGAARFPDTHQAFLIVYTSAGVDLLIVGEQLDIERDGIVGN